ncbi:hypothetical protein RHMOL_Rhmol05G0165900 [Rhododendron molle]|uniref:Uncharacterized protein n=1 Tax=Rhododendron molle TaxID=49168 RepID=A0ACC0NR91_RHOML|nr:hypothetical protein RHMOL_Rhmol05G0165900 [Rhododendron molle]
MTPLNLVNPLDISAHYILGFLVVEDGEVVGAVEDGGGADLKEHEVGGAEVVVDGEGGLVGEVDGDVDLALGIGSGGFAYGGGGRGRGRWREMTDV